LNILFSRYTNTTYVINSIQRYTGTIKTLETILILFTAFRKLYLVDIVTFRSVYIFKELIPAF